MNETDVSEDRLADLLLSRIVTEFLKRLDAGELPDVEEYAEKYPKLSRSLHQILSTLKSLRRIPAAAISTNRLESPEKSKFEQLGDYRILRLAGKGGMGVVYEAWQVSLGRRVALKVLSFVCTLNPRGLQRFRNEAQAAAMLHHQGIVPVYSVGCEHGVHYFAMQFIDGRTLSDIIRNLQQQSRPNSLNIADLNEVEPMADRTTQVDRTRSSNRLRTHAGHDQISDDSLFLSLDSVPRTQMGGSNSTIDSNGSKEFFRWAARLGVQAAEALQHAHSHGVIHRDIKPENVLVDENQHLWITDFGIAQIGADQSLTVTGDVLGTFRYMSPEQALGKRVTIDQRTDVYSLGATLYELLTLKPVFDGADREEILRQIADHEPLPLHRVNYAIPSELETIVLKALAKNPEERYQTAKELADDISRYLRNEPIRAKRSTLIDRVRKWARRHPSWVIATSLVLCLAVVVLGISNVLITLERDAKVLALQKTQKAEENEAERRREADRERQRAEANFRKAREAVDHIFTLAAEKLSDQPHVAQIRRALLEDALEFYEGFAREKNNDPAVRYETARVYWRVGTIYEMLGRNDQAERRLQSAISQLTDLVIEFPTTRDYSDDLLECHAALAFVFQQMHNRPQDHIGTRRLVLQLAEKRSADFPTVVEYAQRLATCHVDLANAFLDTRPEESEQHCRRALALYGKIKIDFPDALEHRSGIAFAHHWLGRALSAQRQFSSAEAEYRLSLQIREQLLAANPKKTICQSQLAHVQGNLSSALVELDRLQEAEQLARSAIELAKTLSEDFPNVPEFRRKLGDHFDYLANALIAQGRSREAIDAVHTCLDIRTQILNGFPNLLIVASSIGSSQYKLGTLLNEAGQQEEAISFFQQAQRSFEESLDKRPDVASNLNRMAWFLIDCPAHQFRNPDRAVGLAKHSAKLDPSSAQSYRILGTAQYRQGQWKDAIDSFHKSIELRSGAGAFEEYCLAMCYWQLGEHDRAHHLLAEAQAWTKKNVRKDERLDRYRKETLELMEQEMVNHQDIVRQAN